MKLTKEKMLQVLDKLRGLQNTQSMAEGLKRAVILYNREVLQDWFYDSICSAYHICDCVKAQAEGIHLKDIHRLTEGITDPEAQYFEWDEDKKGFTDLKFSTVHRLILDIEKYIEKVD